MQQGSLSVAMAIRHGLSKRSFVISLDQEQKEEVLYPCKAKDEKQTAALHEVVQLAAHPCRSFDTLFGWHAASCSADRVNEATALACWQLGTCGLKV